MRPLKTRLAALEAKVLTVLRPWGPRLIGANYDDAKAEYEAEHGAIPEGARVVFRQIVSPAEER